MNTIKTNGLLKFIIILFFSINGLTVSLSQAYFQQKVDYKISAKLDTVDKSISSKITMTYHNNSDDHLDKIIFHTWLNAMKDKTSDYADQVLSFGDHRFHFADIELLGGYEFLRFYINGIERKSKPYVEGNKSYIDILELVLPEELGPRDKIDITIEYKLDLPYAFSRGGYVDKLYQISQWYPKPAVYDNEGWHPMPYLAFGEFYSEFGNYNVELTMPISFSVESTGKRNEDLSTLDLDARERTVVFEAGNVHDFAWFASDYYIPYSDALQLENKSIKVNLFVKEDNQDWQKHMQYAKNALSFFSNEIGEYPYPQMTIVESSCEFGGGMEYPMITILNFCDTDQKVDHLIAHEIGHNWFYGAIASNERDHAWIDEGLTSYYDHKYNDKYYKINNFDNIDFPFFLKNKNNSFSLLENSIIQLEKSSRSMMIDQTAQNFDAANYLAMNYEKSAWIFKYLSAYFGESVFDRAINYYYEKWKFKHPSPTDLIQAFEWAADSDQKALFHALFNEKKSIDFSIKKVKETTDGYSIDIGNKSKTAIPFHLSAYDKNGNLLLTQWYETNKLKVQTISFESSNVDKFVINGETPIFETNHINNNYSIGKFLPKFDAPEFHFLNKFGNPSKNNINILPFVSYNSYDGLMGGFGIFNNLFPQKNFRYFINPNYSFKSNDLVGRFALEKEIMINKGKLRNLQFGLSGQQYHFEKNELFDYDLKYKKISPSIKLNFSRSFYSNSRLEYKFHHISQEEFSFSEGIVLKDKMNDFNIHQLIYTQSALKPLAKTAFKVILQYEKYPNILSDNEEYLKTSFEWKSDIFYDENSLFSVRFFGAYFPINSRRESSSFSNVFTRGSVALTGQGRYDQNYEELYWSRNGVDGSASNQIYITDAGFKNTFGSYHSTGMSNDYSLAVNLISDLPINFSEMLKFRPYFDLAYVSTKTVTADPLKGELFYSGGLAFEIKDVLGIYLPLVNSEALNINYEGSSLLSRLSFKVNFKAFDPWIYSDNPSLLMW